MFCAISFRFFCYKKIYFHQKIVQNISLLISELFETPFFYNLTEFRFGKIDYVKPIYLNFFLIKNFGVSTVNLLNQIHEH